MKQINFSHKYHKLNVDDLGEFTTIRGKSKYTKYSKGEIVEITINRKHKYFAEIIGKSKIVIKNISLATMQEDAEYSNFRINNVQDFLDLLNSFPPRNRFEKAKANLETTVTIFYLRRRKWTDWFVIHKSGTGLRIKMVNTREWSHQRRKIDGIDCIRFRWSWAVHHEYLILNQAFELKEYQKWKAEKEFGQNQSKLEEYF